MVLLILFCFVWTRCYFNLLLVKVQAGQCVSFALPTAYVRNFYSLASVISTDDMYVPFLQSL